MDIFSIFLDCSNDFISFSCNSTQLLITILAKTTIFRKNDNAQFENYYYYLQLYVRRTYEAVMRRMIFPTVYCYHAKTGEFVSEEHSSPLPLEIGVFVAPANSVNIAPPKAGKHQKQIWNGEKWIIMPDFLDETWFDKNGAPIVIKDLGNPEENGLTPTFPTLPLPSLPELKNILKTNVDLAAEYERSKYITNGIGQSMIYEEKYRQAEDYYKNYTLNQQTPDKIPQQKEADYLLLKASLGIDG